MPAAATYCVGNAAGGLAGAGITRWQMNLIFWHVSGRILRATRLPKFGFLGVLVLMTLKVAHVCRADSIGDPGRTLPHADAQSEAIFSQYVRRNQRREKLLQRYSSVRHHEVKNAKGRVLAETFDRRHLSV